MSLFQESIVRKHLGYLDQEVIEQAYIRFKQVYSANKIANIKIAKEEQYQEGFIKDIFGTVLGYSVFPDQPFNIQTEKKNVADSKKADGAIFQGEDVVGVIELKDNKTKNLDAVKDQAFGYKNNHKECSYVISSNFHKLRFYIDDATEYEEFDLYNLDKETFKRFYLYLRKEGLLDKNIPKLLRQETKFHEENITKSLYKDYSSFKNTFFQNVVENNPQFDKLILFRKSQKFLDKVLFVLFAEDKGLVTTNSIVQIIEKWQDLKNDAFDTPKPLYQLVSLFFSNLFIGKKDQVGLVLIPEFGGEIFAPDEVLDNLIVDDDVLKDDLLKLSRYDFNTEIDVNILGHIFEHSLSEIEEVEAELKGEEVNKSNGKRKKDGVFYTPKYITKYIVENTIGKLCKEKKVEMKLDNDIAIFEHQKTDGKLNTKGIELYETLNKYKEWLLTLKILDPACGSGAFLNEAVNFLVHEHQFIDDIIAELTNAPLRLFDTDIAILENNIYGVDINEESIEIAKLSLWLRTAKQGRKLSNLSNNIKCGNSLIDDPALAGDKAFKWQMEFAEVFDNGGFDVVIGNPPYVNVELMPVNEKVYYRKTYDSFFKRGDLFSLFVELATTKLTKNGYVSFIVPSIILNNLSYKLVRENLLSNKWLREVCYTGNKVFQDAIVDTVILIINKGCENTEIKLVDATDFNKHKVDIVPFDFFSKYDNNISVGKQESNSITDKIYLEENFEVGDFFNVFQGVVTGNNEAFIFENKEVALSNGIENELLFPMCHGRDISKWHIENTHVMLYINEDVDIKSYPGAYSWLSNFKEALTTSKSSDEKNSHWYSLHRPRVKHELLTKPKILIQNTRNESLKTRIVATIDENGLLGTQGLNIIISKSKIDVYFLLGLLNSKVINFLFSNKLLNLAIKADYLKKLKFPVELGDSIIRTKAQEISNLSSELFNLSQQFQRLVIRKFNLDVLNNKLKEWYLLSYSGFIKELSKKKIKLSLNEEVEWEKFFTIEANKALGLKAKIEEDEEEINKIVYQLYKLTEEEIKIVEES